MMQAALKYLFPDIDLSSDVVIEDDGKGPRIAKWLRAERQPTDAELLAAEPAALAAEQVEEAKRIESHTARDDAKRALSALDTIIAGAPTATTAQLRAAVEQLARIQKHAILATLGR